MRSLALVVALAACGGSSPPPAAPATPAPDAAIAEAVPEPEPEPESEPQALPPPDLSTEQGLMRKPRETPPPATTPASPPPSMAHYPPNCVRYMEAFLKLTQCEKLGAAKESMMQGYQATVDAWNDLAKAGTAPEVKQAWDEGRKQGYDGMVQTATAMGCDL